MPEPLTAAELAARWTPERIAETMRTEHNVNWAPPPVEATLAEEEAAIQEYVAAAAFDAGPAAEWTVMDPVTHEMRPLDSAELFDLTERVKATMPDVAVTSTPAWGTPEYSDEPIEDTVGSSADPEIEPTPHQMRMATPAEVTEMQEWSERPGWRVFHPDFLDGLPRESPTSSQVDSVQSVMKDYGVPAETRAQARWESRMNPQQAAVAQSMANHPSGKLMPIRPVQ